MSHLKKRFASHYWLSLLTVLLPVVIFGIFIYTYNINSNKNYIEQTRLSSFQQASAQIGYLLEVLKGIASDFDTDILSMENADSQILLALNEMEQKAPLPVDAFYYIKGDKYVYSSSQKLHYYDFEGQYENTYNFSRPRFYYRLNSDVSPRLLRFYLQSQVEAEGLIAFICPVQADSVVFFFLSENSLKEVFSDYFGDDYGTLLVYNNALDVILSSLPDNKEALDSSLLRIKGTGLLILEDTGQIALRQTIGMNEMTIVTVMDKREFYHQLTNDQLILSGLILLMILCCLLFIILGVRQVRKPIHALVRNIAGNDADRLPEDEFEYLHNAFQESRENTQRMLAQLTTQNNLLAAHFALRLINGYFRTADEMLHTADYLGIAINGDCWVVMEVLPQSAADAEEQDFAGFSPVSAAFPENTTLLTAQTPWYCGVCCIFNYKSKEQEESFITLLAGKLEAFLHSIGYPPFRIGVGTPCRDPLYIKHSFYEADAAASSIDGNAPDSIAFYRTDKINAVSDYYLPPMEKSLLTSSIRRGETQIALSALNSLLDSVEAPKSFLYLQIFASHIANLLLQLSEENGLTIDQGDWTNMIVFQSLEVFRTSACAYVEKLCAQVQLHNSLQENREKNAVLTFIKENYTKEAFSLDYTADALHISKAKINAIIKENIDLGFQQYITLLRMNEMKRQLIETDKPVQDIIRDVGYLDVSSSIRKFKALEKVTPGQYRSLNQGRRAL